jgi:hypothetical protein
MIRNSSEKNPCLVQKTTPGAENDAWCRKRRLVQKMTRLVHKATRFEHGIPCVGQVYA